MQGFNSAADAPISAGPASAGDGDERCRSSIHSGPGGSTRRLHQLPPGAAQRCASPDGPERAGKLREERFIIKVVEMHYKQGLSQQEIGKKLNVSRTTIS